MLSSACCPFHKMATSTAFHSTATATESQSWPTLAPRQEFRTITQTVRLADTTFVTEVTLGGPPRLADDNPTAAPAPSVHDANSSSSLSGAQLGAIIGGVLGFVLLVGMLWCCMFANKRRQQQMEEDDYDDMYEIDSEGPPPPRRTGRAGRQARYYRHFFEPPAPIYQVNRREPWEPSFSGPRRHL